MPKFSELDKTEKVIFLMLAATFLMMVAQIVRWVVK